MPLTIALGSISSNPQDALTFNLVVTQTVKELIVANEEYVHFGWFQCKCYPVLNQLAVLNISAQFVNENY